MKINRLLEITIILLSRGTTTARELADRFGVSTRTIYRDIDVLSSSGIPIYATQGANGGISLLENYSLGRTTLTDKESESIVFALKAIQVTKYPDIDLILDKLGSIYKNNAADWIHIDFLPWGSNPNQYDKIALTKEAILSSKMIEFDYISSRNIKTRRQMEPLRLIFKGQSWYLWGWSVEREDFRTFRISRIKSVQILDTCFDRNRQRTPKPRLTSDAEIYTPNVKLELKFTKEALHRLYDDFEDDMILGNGDGTFTICVEFPEDEWVLSYIMSFGDYVEVVSPPHIQKIIREKALRISNKYIAR